MSVATPSSSEAVGTVPSIPPMVSILDAADSQANPESYPVRHFKDYYLGFEPKWPFEHDCAASLIGTSIANKQSYLLTSAHCVTGYTQNGMSIDRPLDNSQNLNPKPFGPDSVQAIPFVFGFPGAVLCQAESLSSDSWYGVASAKTVNPKTITYESLNAIIPGLQSKLTCV